MTETLEKPGLLVIAGAVLVSPTRKPNLSEELWQSLFMASTEPTPDPEVVGAAIRAAEAFMGTTDFHRIQALETAEMLSAEEAAERRLAIRRRLSGDKRRQKLEEHRRAATLNDGLRKPGISERVADKLEAAEVSRDKAARLRTQGPKVHRREITDHLAAARRLELEAHALHAQEQDDTWRYGAVAETIGLAMERGEDVDHETVEMETLIKGEFGEQLYHRKGEQKGEPVVRVDRVHRTVIRTGLGYAYEKGHLSAPHGEPGLPKEQALFVTGCMYAEAYEVSVGRCGSNGEGSGGAGAKGPQVRIVEAGETLAIMRRGLKPRQLKVLDRVCGDGVRARQVATEMNAGFPATSRALRGGLSRALDNWAEALKEGEPGRAAKRVKEAGRVLSKVKA